MYRNLYDVDCVTWSPQGRIFQIEYAMEAVKQGSCCVGVRTNEFAALLSVKKAASKLADYYQKLFKIDNNIGVAMSGITADAKVICNFMRNESLHHKYIYDYPIATSRLVEMVADKCQVVTQRYSKRPFGVGLLVAGYDKTGPHIYETCPSGNFFESYAIAFGARSQASRTYLGKTFEQFSELSLDELLHHGVKALKSSLAQDASLTVDNLCIGVVGKDYPWKELSPNELQHILDLVDNGGVVPMEIDSVEAVAT